MRVDETGHDQAATLVVALPARVERGVVGGHAGDAAAFDQQPVVAAKTHHGRIDLAPLRGADEVEQVAAQGHAVGWWFRGHRFTSVVGVVPGWQRVHAPSLPRRTPFRPRPDWGGLSIRFGPRSVMMRRPPTPAAQGCSHPCPGLAMNDSPIVFFHRGAAVRVAGVEPTTTVLDWLREQAHCTGTKEGCNEGDCGACTVVIGEVAAQSAQAPPGLSLQPANACIRLLPTLHGKALYTVEDLKAVAGGAAAVGAQAPLHPVQQALVDAHASQCGFCTPGFVMSLFEVYERHLEAGTRPTRQQLADALSGNLCRCTGYRPILDAAERMFELPAVRLDSGAAVDALAGIGSGEATFTYRPAVDGPGFHAPRTLAALAALRQSLPGAQLLAGSTDVGLWVNKQFRDLGEIVYLGDVAELKQVGEELAADGRCELVIGAGASLEAAWQALTARFDGLNEVWLRFASPPIRSAGTMGGNVANGSPIGDSAPVLIALDAQIELRCGERVRRLLLADFYTGYLQNRLEPGEFVQALRVPLPAAGSALHTLRAYKISKRYDSDISALCAVLRVRIDDGIARDVRVAFGGMAATVQRATATEAALEGQPWTEAGIESAQQALATDFTPLSDLRASSAYRLKVAQNLLKRFWLETRADQPLAADRLSVWTARHAELASPA